MTPKVLLAVLATLIHGPSSPNGLRLTGDVNRDRVVDALDVLIVLRCYGGPAAGECCVADCNLVWEPRILEGGLDVGRWVLGDGCVDALDLLTVNQDWTFPGE